MSQWLNCRSCTENPFAMLFFGSGGGTTLETAPAGTEVSKAAKKSCRKDETQFHPRSEEEVTAIVKEWEQYCHPRAREFFRTKELLDDVLRQLASGIDRADDPVLSSDAKCVYWYGEITKEDVQAAIRMVKPGEEAESVTYVNRVLAFIFATERSFKELMELPKEPFKMYCGDQLCVHLAHITVGV